MHSDVPRLFSSHSWDDPVGLRNLLELTVLKTGLSRGTGLPAMPSLRVAVCDGSPGRRAAHRGRRSLAFLLLYVLLRSRPEASHVPRPLTVGSDHSRSPRTWPRGPQEGCTDRTCPGADATFPLRVRQRARARAVSFSSPSFRAALVTCKGHLPVHWRWRSSLFCHLFCRLPFQGASFLLGLERPE